MLCSRLCSLRTRVSFVSKWRRLHRSSALTRLVEIGRFEEPKQCYPSGQLFLHRIFGYRGVVLFYWTSRVYDRDIQESRVNYSHWDDEGKLSEKIKELKPERHTYYQVLIDQRDFSLVRTLPEAITMTANRNDNSIYAVPGLDYVNHEDILPYATSYKEPIMQHDFFPQFFAPSFDENESGSPFIAKDYLASWHQKNICWLEKVEVHRETNRNVRVTVMPFYMGSKEIQQSSDVYWWRYCIRIENLSGSRVQLRQRHWRIYSSSGSLETVKGDGVIGQQPVLSVRQPAFQYSSHVSLQVPNGHMWGTFRMEREDGKYFDVRIPPFLLESHE